MHVNPLASLRQLKGCPLSVLVALTIVKPRQVSSTWLMGCTGYSGDNVTAATWYLKEFGYIDCDSHRTNWRLAEEGVQQLPLPVSMLEPEDTPEPIQPEPTKPEPPTNPDPEIPEPDSSSRDFNTCMTLMYLAKIGEPMASTLCEMDHVTPEYLDAHIQAAKRDNIDIPLLIFRIKKADPIPDLPQDRNSRYRNDPWLCADCMCHPCQCDDEEYDEEEEEENNDDQPQAKPEPTEDLDPT